MTSLSSIATVCQDLLHSFPEAKSILDYANSRVSPSAQERFGFGYFPTNEHLSALTQQVSADALIKLGLAYPKIVFDGVSTRNVIYTTFCNHNMLIPFKDVYGEVIALVGRTIGSDKDIPKYKNTSFKKGRHLFGLYEARAAIEARDQVIVVEGQMDAITAQDKGLPNTVAIGSSSMSFEQCALLCRYTKNFFLLLDADEAGRVGTQKIIDDYGAYARVRVGKLPMGVKDLDEFLNEGGDVGVIGV